MNHTTGVYILIKILAIDDNENFLAAIQNFAI